MDDEQRMLIADFTARICQVQVTYDKLLIRINDDLRVVDAQVARALALSKTKLDEARLWGAEASAFADLSR